MKVKNESASVNYHNNKKINKKRHGDGGMVIHPSISGRIADAIILLFLITAMFICVVPMWHTLMCSLSDGQLLQGHNVWYGGGLQRMESQTGQVIRKQLITVILQF